MTVEKTNDPIMIGYLIFSGCWDVSFVRSLKTNLPPLSVFLGFHGCFEEFIGIHRLVLTLFRDDLSSCLKYRVGEGSKKTSPSLHHLSPKGTCLQSQ